MSEKAILTRRGFFRRLAQAGAAAVVGVALPKEAASRRVWWGRWRPDAQRMYCYHRSACWEFVALKPKAPYIGPVSAFEVNEGARSLERIVEKAVRT